MWYRQVVAVSLVLDGLVEKPSVCAREADYGKGRFRPPSREKRSMAKHPVAFGQVGDPRACRPVQQDVQRVSNWLSPVVSPITRSAFVSWPCPVSGHFL